MHARLAILNGFGRTLGDSIIGLQALHAATSLGLIAPDPVLFRLTMPSPVIEDAYRLAAEFADIRPLPWDDATRERPFAGAAGFEHVIDIRDFAFDPAFRGMAMIDYFLSRLGIAPASVPPEWRRNTWLAPRLPRFPRGEYVLLCPATANPMRDMPAEAHAHILAWFARHTAWPLRSQASLPRAASLAELAELVAGARLVVSADTAMLHLADAMATPCLAFFTTHEPVWRVRDYPLCTGVKLPADLPQALEFPRGAEDVVAARAAWFPAGADLSWLDAHLAAACSRIGR